MARGGGIANDRTGGFVLRRRYITTRVGAAWPPRARPAVPLGRVVSAAGVGPLQCCRRSRRHCLCKQSVARGLLRIAGRDLTDPTAASVPSAKVKSPTASRRAPCRFFPLVLPNLLTNNLYGSPANPAIRSAASTF